MLNQFILPGGHKSQLFLVQYTEVFCNRFPGMQEKFFILRKHQKYVEKDSNDLVWI